MLEIAMDDRRAVAVVAAIRGGDAAALKRLLRDVPATARFIGADGTKRSLLHIAAD